MDNKVSKRGAHHDPVCLATPLGQRHQAVHWKCVFPLPQYSVSAGKWLLARDISQPLLQLAMVTWLAVANGTGVMHITSRPSPRTLSTWYYSMVVFSLPALERNFKATCWRWLNFGHLESQNEWEGIYHGNLCPTQNFMQERYTTSIVFGWLYLLGSCSLVIKVINIPCFLFLGTSISH